MMQMTMVERAEFAKSYMLTVNGVSPQALCEFQGWPMCELQESIDDPEILAVHALLD